MKDSTREIIAAGIRAPSGDNCQPWLFRSSWEKETARLDIHILPDRAKSFFDYRFRGSFLSIGAVVENVRIRAATFGLGCETEYLCGVGPEQPAVRVILDKADEVAPDAEQLDAMLERTVNRRPFLPFSPRQDRLKILGQSAVDETATHFFTARSEINEWARLIYLADRIRYSHPTIHSEVFSKILLSRQEADDKRMGLEIDRLGIGPLANPLVRLLRPWDRMAKLKRYGVDNFLARQSHLTAMMTGAMVLVTVDADDPLLWIKAGEQTQRLWVTAQRIGLCVHPMTVALYLDMRYRSTAMEGFLPEHESLLKEIETRIHEHIPQGVGAMLFRIGRTIPMKNTAIRLPIDNFVAE